MRLKADDIIDQNGNFIDESDTNQVRNVHDCEEELEKRCEKKKWKLSALDIYVIFSITALIVYTIFAHYMVIEYGASLDVLTTCFFAFFGGEIVTCALIKIFKLKEPPKSDGGDICG